MILTEDVPTVDPLAHAPQQIMALEAEIARLMAIHAQQVRRIRDLSVTVDLLRLPCTCAPPGSGERCPWCETRRELLARLPWLGLTRHQGYLVALAFDAAVRGVREE